MTVESVARLASELEHLIKPAASDDSIQELAPTLCALARSASSSDMRDTQGDPITTPRGLLLVGISRLQAQHGRSADPGANKNYPLSYFGDAAEILLGVEAEKYGTERRWGEVSMVFGAKTLVPITGKRVGGRVCHHLARIIIAITDESTTPPHRPVTTEPTDPGTVLLLERTTDIQELLRFVVDSHLLRIPAWHAPLAQAIAIRARDDLRSVGIAPLARFLDDKHPALTPERLALAGIAVQYEIGSGEFATDARSFVANCLLSRDISRQIPAELTFIRERAAVALSVSGDPRPGVALAASGTPEHLFVALPTSPKAVTATFLARYPVTRKQFLALMPETSIERAGRKPADNCPMTDVTFSEAVEYCSRLEALMRSAGTFGRNVPDGYPAEQPVESNLRVRLPTRSDLDNAIPQESPFPWSSAVDSSIAIARRLSYDRLLPVGLFPDEQLANGLSDLAGLVWHWVDEPWPASGRALRFVHGGGFGRNTQFFKSDCYLGADEGTRRSDRGFRPLIQMSRT